MIPQLKKSLGQHLLVSDGVLREMVKFMKIGEEVVVEIGPGTGNLTEKLLQSPLKRLFLLEIDREMIEYLHSRFKEEISEGRLVILNRDARTFDFYSLNAKPLKVVGNLPYNVANKIIENVVYHLDLVSSFFFLVQKEVGERLLSGKSWLSVLVKTFFEVKYLMTVPPRFFVPKPKVYSSFLEFSKKIPSPLPSKEIPGYSRFLKEIFRYPKKKLKHKILHNFSSLDLSENLKELLEKRVHQITLDEFLSLYFHLKSGF